MKSLKWMMFIAFALSFIHLTLFAGTRAVIAGAPIVTSSVGTEDEAILKDLQSKLLQEKLLIGTSITIASDGSVVTLSGEVDTQAQADTAILAAKSIPGVKDVKSNIRVKQGVTVNIIRGTQATPVITTVVTPVQPVTTPERSVTTTVTTTPAR